MTGIALLGASGFTGALVARELARWGHSFVAAGRDMHRVRAAVSGLGEVVVDVRRVDLDDPASVRAALAGAELAINTIGPFGRWGRPVVDAAIEAGVDHLDVAAEPTYLQWVYEQRDAAAHAAGVTLVPAVGFLGVLGDLLGSVAASAVDPTEIHVAYRMTGRRGAGGLSGGSRRTLATMVGEPGVVLRGGMLATEWPAESRRLAWFPRPVGPAHAAGVPGSEALSLPRHVAGLERVGTYLAVPGWQAELLQLGANAARWAPVRRRAVAWLERDVRDPSEAERLASTWACVAEAAGRRTGEVARAWANGRDQYGVTAVAAVAVAEAVLARPAQPGVRPPATVDGPDHLLDVLSERAGLRWSVTRPRPPAVDER